MANVNIPDMTPLTAPATDDVIEVYDTSASENKKLALSYVALVGTANTFNVGQVINAGAAGTIGLVVNSAASATTYTQVWQYNGVTAAVMYNVSDQDIFQFGGRRNYGNNMAGASIQVLRNEYSTGEGYAAGTIAYDAGNAIGLRYTWVDASGNLRINSAAPTGSIGSPTVSDTAGTVIGTQTSTLASKNILGEGVCPADALATILETPVKRFTYKSGAYNGGEFHGIIADYSPEFAMDNGKVFSPVSAFGYTIQAIKALTERIIALET